MEEISTSFCFICLLHLANEKGLKLESDVEGRAVANGVGDSGIGNIWNVKVSCIILCLKLQLNGVVDLS